MPRLYEEKEQTYSCHAMGHLPDQVPTHGPLILHSSFVFEAMIRHLKRQFYDTRGIVVLKNCKKSVACPKLWNPSQEGNKGTTESQVLH